MMLARAQDEFSKAKAAAQGIPWLVALSRYGLAEEEKGDMDALTASQVENMETVLATLGTTYDRRYATRERDILSGLESKDAKKFESAHKMLGEMLGFDSDNKETEGAPDPWWLNGNKCLVFEDHSSADIGTAIDISKARQAASHPTWMRANVPAAKSADILAVLITPSTTVRKPAVPYLEDVALWSLADFQAWAKEALSVIRTLRTTFKEAGDLPWRMDAMTTLKKYQLDAGTIFSHLKANRAADKLNPID
jgi:hypothetical protein